MGGNGAVEAHVVERVGVEMRQMMAGRDAYAPCPNLIHELIWRKMPKERAHILTSCC